MQADVPLDFSSAFSDYWGLRGHPDFPVRKSSPNKGFNSDDFLKDIRAFEALQASGKINAFDMLKAALGDLAPAEGSSKQGFGKSGA
jgi:hypothetical protein